MICIKSSCFPFESKPKSVQYLMTDIDPLSEMNEKRNVFHTLKHTHLKAVLDVVHTDEEAHPPIPDAGVGQLLADRAGVEAGEVRQHGRAHEASAGPPKRSHHAPGLQKTKVSG